MDVDRRLFGGWHSFGHTTYISQFNTNSWLFLMCTEVGMLQHHKSRAVTVTMAIDIIISQKNSTNVK